MMRKQSVPLVSIFSKDGFLTRSRKQDIRLNFSVIYRRYQGPNSLPGKPINLYILSKYKTIYTDKIDAIQV